MTISVILLVNLQFGTSQGEPTEVEGAVKIGEFQLDTLNDSEGGIIRWDSMSKDYFGWNGIEWKSFTIYNIDDNIDTFSLSSPLDTRFTHGPLWSIDGNIGSQVYLNPPKMGTRDSIPVLFITNNKERMRISDCGDIKMSNTLEIEDNLTVRHNTDLNTISGQTKNNGPFSVLNEQPSLLSGTLVVEGLSDLNRSKNLDPGLKVYGYSNLNGSFSVIDSFESIFTGQVYLDDLTQSDSASVNSGALVIDGGVGIGRNINIGGNFSLAGSATFAGEVSFASPVTISSVEESNDVTSGALIVRGGVGIGKRLNVGGATRINNRLRVIGNTTLKRTLDVANGTVLNRLLSVNGATSLGSKLSVMGNTELGSNLLVHKAVDIDNKLDVTGKTVLDSTLNVSGAVTMKEMLEVSGYSTFGNDLNVGGSATFHDSIKVFDKSFLHNHMIINASEASGDPTSGALSILGGTSIQRSLSLGGNAFIGSGTDHNLDILGSASFSDFLSVKSNNELVASFENTSNQNGIQIKIDSQVSHDNKYVTFSSSRTNNANVVTGNIKGQNVGNLNSDIVFINQKKLYETVTLAYIAQVAVASINTAIAAGFVIAAATSSTACVGFGACTNVPTPSIILAAGSALAISAAALVAVSLGLDAAEKIEEDFVNDVKSSVGISYQSGSADYAEWLLKKNRNEELIPGMIVGVKNGRISLNTEYSDKVLAVSSNPIVLGNVPPPGRKKRYEKVAFMGQVPVIVIGKVRKGDYIVPTGLNDGFAKAISPENMTIKDYTQIVGKAWSESDNEIYNKINVAIGLNGGDVAKMVSNQEKDIAILKKRILELKKSIDHLEIDMMKSDLKRAKIIPGYGSRVGLNEKDIADMSKKVRKVQKQQKFKVKSQFQINSKNPTTLTYFELPEDLLVNSLELAKKYAMKSGEDLNVNPFWQKMKSDSSFEKVFINELQTKLDQTYNLHNQIDKKHAIK
jgi:hypothetical protein